MRVSLAIVAVLVNVACATMFAAGSADAPSNPDQWKAYVKRWAHPSELAVKAHAQRTWQCDQIAATPVGYGALVGDAGDRTPQLEWAVAGCDKDARYFVTCPASMTSAVPLGKVACDVRRKHVVAQGLPATASEAGSIEIVDDPAGGAPTPR